MVRQGAGGGQLSGVNWCEEQSGTILAQEARSPAGTLRPIIDTPKQVGLKPMRPDIVRFEGFEYRRREQGLFHSGVRLPVGSRALALLDALVAQPGVYLPPAELMRSAWPDTHVDESNLRVQIAGLRHHLGAGGHAIIRNAPGRGYAFGGRIDHDPATVLDDWILAFAPAELKQIEPAVRALLVRIEAISGASQTGTAGGRGIRAHAP
jgi:DNA-binding winged helix-turn-helix (wHTH) protein